MSRRWFVVVVTVVASALVLGGCSRDRDDTNPTSDAAGIASSSGVTTTTTPAPASCATAKPAPAGPDEGVLAFGGVDRTYLLHVPPGYAGTTRVPVVFDFHGHGSSAAAQMAYSEIRPIADREGFLVVAPNGQGSPRHFSLLGATATDADDVEFTIELLDEVAERFCIDPTRVYATGMSNGGALSSVLACRGAERFAAVAAMAAMIYLPACDATPGPRPVPILSMMGTADPVVPFAGGRVNCCGNPNIPAAAATMDSFARHAGCEAEPSIERIGNDVELRRFGGCSPGAAVDFYVIEGGGHTWPGAAIDLAGAGLGTTTASVEATESLWSFFERHRLPSAR